MNYKILPLIFFSLSYAGNVQACRRWPLPRRLKMGILIINRMFKTACLATLLIVHCSSRAEDNLAAESAMLPTPILAPDQAVKLAEDYVTKLKYRDRNQFRLSGVLFKYFSKIPAPPGVIEVGWTIYFDCVPEQLDCEFSVGISNDKIPIVVLYPAR